MSAEINAQETAAGIIASGNGYVFTGAGISVPSGIPDFRSPDGIWARADQFMVGTFQGLQLDPIGYHRFWSPLYKKALESGPNTAHRGVRRLEELRLSAGVVTQNIDNLHQVAGSERVLELHGNGMSATCVDCGASIATRELLERENFDCPGCGGVVRHDVVLFNDPLPAQTLNEAFQLAVSSSWVLVIGSSLAVYPAASVPEATLRAGGRLIVVDVEPTPLDPHAVAVLRGDCAELVPQLVQVVQRRLARDH